MRMVIVTVVLTLVLLACAKEMPTNRACSNGMYYNDTLGRCVGNPKQSADLFCGGIAGISCPPGFSCKLDGGYPDAGGTCVKETTDKKALDYCDTADDCVIKPSCCDCGLGNWINKQYVNEYSCTSNLRCACMISERHAECKDHHCIGVQGLS